jgi:hypothetical protein
MPPALFRVFPRPSVVQIPPATRIFQRFSAFFRGKTPSPQNTTRRLTLMARLNSPPIRVIRGSNSPMPLLFSVFSVCFRGSDSPATRIFQRFSAPFRGKTPSPHNNTRRLTLMAHLNSPPNRVIRGSNSPMPLHFSVFSVCFRGSDSPSHPYFSAFFRALPRQNNITSQQHPSAYDDGSPQQPTYSCHSWFKLPQPPVFFRVFQRPSAAKKHHLTTALVG